MQNYLKDFYGNTRDTIAKNVAMQWFRAPADFKFQKFVPPSDIYSIKDNWTFVRDNNLAIWVHAAKYRHIYARNGYTTPAAAYKPVIVSTMGVCQLTGKIRPLNELSYKRIYNLKLLCSPINTRQHISEYIWVEDTRQYVLRNDSRIDLFTFYGDRQHFAKSEEWAKENYDLEYGDHEDAYFIAGESIYVDNIGERVSNWWANHNEVFNCESCGDTFTSDRYGSDDRCDSCESSNDRDYMSGDLYEYDFDVLDELAFDDKGVTVITKRSLKRPTQHGKGGTGMNKPSLHKVYMGVELEIEADDMGTFNKAVGSINSGDYARCKSDGSLNDEVGFEIVSKPCGIETHRTLGWDTTIAPFADNLNPTRHCGLHVHVSRAPFRDVEIGRVLAFLHRQLNRKFVEAIARRSENSYTRFTDGYIKACKQRSVADMLAHGEMLLSNERYTALNVTDNTVEFRIFASTRTKLEYMAAVSFCEALMLYAHYSPLPLLEWTKVENFIAWVKERKVASGEVDDKGKPIMVNPYPELLEYIALPHVPKQSDCAAKIRRERTAKVVEERVVGYGRHTRIPRTQREVLVENITARLSLPEITAWLANGDMRRVNGEWVPCLRDNPIPSWVATNNAAIAA